MINNKTNKVNIAILGLGTVGSGTYDILTGQHDALQRHHGVDICVAKVLDKSKTALIKKGIAKNVTCDCIEDIVNDSSISIVVETMGGISPAKDYIIKILSCGKSVVTANKELLAKHGAELEQAAKLSGSSIYFEAAVAGGIPIIKVLQEGMQANNLQRAIGIVNGTTNYILSAMAQDNVSYDTALKTAQKLGFAEVDPTADVEGYDSAYKLSILSSLAFFVPVSHSKIYREGISNISIKDIENAKSLGYAIKLLAIAQRCNNQSDAKNGAKTCLELRVHPTFVPLEHPLASVNKEFNAIFLQGDNVGDIMLYGKGAGAKPTASAIVSDIVSCIKNSNNSGGGGNFNTSIFSSTNSVEVVDNFTSSYYLALSVLDKPGALASITKVFSSCGVSISQLIQKKSSSSTGNAELVFLTHPAQEFSFSRAAALIADIEEVKSIDSLIRVLV